MSSVTLEDASFARATDMEGQLDAILKTCAGFEKQAALL
jgi:hypothetical protein